MDKDYSTLAEKTVYLLAKSKAVNLETILKSALDGGTYRLILFPKVELNPLNKFVSLGIKVHFKEVIDSHSCKKMVFNDLDQEVRYCLPLEQYNKTWFAVNEYDQFYEY